MSIDFVAHHEIQFQSCRDVYEELSKVHDCRALIGQNCSPTGADVAVLLDHAVFQPGINKRNYTYLVHMSHDLADWDIYQSERKQLSEFDLILVPGDMHYEQAKKNLGSVYIFKIGWPKLDAAGEGNNVTNRNDTDSLNIIYAPTFINNREWEQLLPELIRTGHRIIIKNHIYYDFESGVAPPKGSEEEYKQAVVSLLDMEAFLAKTVAPNIDYIDRRSNLCSLFSHADALITDSSSASMEFLSFGLSIETGRYGKEIYETKPCSSIVTEQIKYFPINNLIRLLKSEQQFVELIQGGKRDAAEIGNSFIYSPPHGSSKHAASVIDLFLYLKQNDVHLSIDFDNPILRKLQKWL